MPQEPTGQQIIAGGEQVIATTLAGERREIFVRQLRPTELGAYLTAESHGELFPLILTTGFALEELDTLSLESMEALIAADRRQNFTYARRYEKRRAEGVARQLDALRDQSPEVYARLQAELAKLLPSLASSLASPPPVADGAPPPQ